MSAGKAVVFVVGGACIGSGVTALILKKKYAAKAEAEIASVREAYLKRLNEMEAEFDQERKDEGKPPVAPVETHPEENEVPMERVVPTNEQLRKAYHKIPRATTANLETVEGLSEVNESLGYTRKEDPVNEKPKYEYLEADNDINKPYVIPVQAYMDDENMYTQLTLTYYAGDKTLIVEDSDEVVEDIDQTVGFENLTKFGEESGNDDTVYVRNDKREIEYEVLRDPGKYSENVQGIDTWDDSPEPKNPIRKFVR
ncbi:hypothetical protein QCN32_gp54 [Arthrobacter phage Niktson]|uniref:Uncharacterized protein n=1 Tax=Arthrobacter phage Niktson TaxID=2014347 RepID=A0A218M5M3_9CAUD|nr:hypothetical protein QCN32_gp54 [Arthrobacter phage Niktson]ASD52276.1 hypothetical protein NIKTSON_54 [Arthrobacter phage Niktson]ASD52370.1 hypothetical protein ELEPHANTMAN_54 [Arthrobacter phage ElephantMan]